MDPELIAGTQGGDPNRYLGRDADDGEGTFHRNGRVGALEPEAGLRVMQLQPDGVLAGLAFHVDAKRGGTVGPDRGLGATGFLRPAPEASGSNLGAHPPLAEQRGTAGDHGGGQDYRYSASRWHRHVRQRISSLSHPFVLLLSP